MNNKSNRKIKIAAILLTALLLFTCFTTACQPTPDQSVVIQKDLEKMIEKAVGETDSTDTASTLKEKLELPETYTLQRDSVKGYLHLNVERQFLCS